LSVNTRARHGVYAGHWDVPRADVAHGRLALGALLGDRRIRIYNDGRIEGARTSTLATRNSPGARGESVQCVPATDC